MTKGEYSKLLKEREKEAMDQKQHEYYDRVSHVIDYANDHKAALVVKGSQEQLDWLIGQLFDRTVNTIKRIKTLDSEEWKIIGDFISHIEAEVKKIVGFNQQILAYYESPDFLKIKEICAALMSLQREFNEYINENVQSISQLFGTRVVRSETVNNLKLRTWIQLLLSAEIPFKVGNSRKFAISSGRLRTKSAVRAQISCFEA